MIIEYQNIVSLLDNSLNQPSKFRTEDLVEINNESRGTYNTNSQTKFKTAILKSSLCDYSDGYILLKGYVIVNKTTANGAATNNTNETLLRNCAPFTNCISEINNTQVDNAKDINIVIPMYNFIEYNDNYSKTYRSLSQYCKDIQL